VMGDVDIRTTARRLRSRRRAAVSPATDDDVAVNSSTSLSDSQSHSSALFFLTSTASEDAGYVPCRLTTHPTTSQ